MIYRVERTIPSENDLDGILNYILFKLMNRKAAADLLAQYEEKLLILRETPYLYGLSHNECLAQKGYHQFDFGNYIAFYTIDDISRVVYIVRIFYKKQDYENLL